MFRTTPQPPPHMRVTSLLAPLAVNVDSLRAVVAYQDTRIARLATLTHVPWPPPRN